MIVLDKVSVTLKDRTRRTTPLEDLSGRIPNDRRVGILGPPKSGKTTLLRILSGLQRPTSGRIFSDATISYPVGTLVGVIAAHSLRRNLVTAAKLYRVDPVKMVQIVAEAADLRDFIDLPFSYVPPDVAIKFRYAVSYALPFNTYLMDVLPLPFMQHPARMQDLLASRMSHSGFILCSANENVLSKYCDVIYLLKDRKLVETANAKATIVAYRTQRLARNQAGIDSGELKTLVREARHLLQLRDFAAAEQKAQDCYDKFPDALDCLLLLADVAKAAGNRAQANEMLKRACDNFPDRDEPWLAVQRLLSGDHAAELARPWADRMIQHKNEKIRLAGTRILSTYGDPEEALVAWRTIVGPNPTTTVGLADIGRLEFELGRHEQALATAKVELSMDPGSWRALLLKARVEQALERYDDVTETTILLAEVKPELSMPFVTILRRLGRDEEADRLFRVLQGLR